MRALQSYIECITSIMYGVMPGYYGDDEMSDTEIEREAQQATNNLDRLSAQLDAERDAQPASDAAEHPAVKEYISRLNAEDQKRRRKMQDQLQKEREELQRQIAERDKVLAEREKALESVSRIAEKLDARAIAQQLKREAELEGLVDFDLLAFVDRSSVKVTDDGDVIGAKEAIQKLKEKKSFAFKKPMTTIRTESDVPPELSDLLQPVGDNQKMMTQTEFMASLGLQDAF